jgi:hypothetical protein
MSWKQSHHLLLLKGLMTSFKMQFMMWRKGIGRCLLLLQLHTHHLRLSQFQLLLRLSQFQLLLRLSQFQLLLSYIGRIQLQEQKVPPLVSEFAITLLVDVLRLIDFPMCMSTTL